MNTQPTISAPYGSSPESYGLRQRQRAAIRTHDKRVVRELHPHAAVHPAIKLARKLAALPLLKVASRAQRFARRASTASHLLRRLNPESLLRVPLESSVRGHNASFGQAVAELKAREEHAIRNPLTNPVA